MKDSTFKVCQEIRKMIFSEFLILKSIFAVMVTLTLLRSTYATYDRSTYATYDDFFSAIFHACRHSVCDDYPVCPNNFDTLTQKREGCPNYKTRNYCCPSGTGPQCFYTGCDRDTSCPVNYRELDRTKIGCPEFEVKAYCCKQSHLPYCFDMKCPTISEPVKFCPSEYRETSREKGRSSGCDEGFSERVTCCRHDEDYNRNRDDGSMQTNSRENRLHWRRGMFSGGVTSFTVFLKYLVVLPILLAILQVI